MDNLSFETAQVLLAIGIMIVAFAVGRYLGQYFR